MNESVIQLKKLHTIENIEHAIFALERGMPVHPRVIDTLKTLHQVLIADYNNMIAEASDEDDSATGDGGDDSESSESST